MTSTNVPIRSNTAISDDVLPDEDTSEVRQSGASLYRT